MKYYADDVQGVRHGPLSEDQLIELADKGLIKADSAVKKEIMRGWFPASDLKFLASHLSAGAAGNGEEQKSNGTSFAQEAPTTTAFQNQLIPVHAGLLLRLQAACSDLLLFAASLLLILAAGTIAAFSLSETVKDGPEVQAVLKMRQSDDKKSGKTENDVGAKRKEEKQKSVSADKRTTEMAGTPSVVSDAQAGYRIGSIWKNKETREVFVCLSASKNKAVWCRKSRLQIIAAAVWIICLLVGSYLFLIPVALRAQTPGMRYFGIFISDAKDPTREVLELRAVSEYLLSLITWIAAPILLIRRKPTIAENVTGTRIIRTAAKQ